MKTYQNPLSLPRQDPEQGLGDPFVLRFNGRYYLCPSPGGEKQGVLLWESTDMVTWSFLGNVAPDELLHHTYAQTGKDTTFLFPILPEVRIES